MNAFAQSKLLQSQVADSKLANTTNMKSRNPNPKSSLNTNGSQVQSSKFIHSNPSAHA